MVKVKFFVHEFMSHTAGNVTEGLSIVERRCIISQKNSTNEQCCHCEIKSTRSLTQPHDYFLCTSEKLVLFSQIRDKLQKKYKSMYNINSLI